MPKAIHTNDESNSFFYPQPLKRIFPKAKTSS